MKSGWITTAQRSAALLGMWALFGAVITAPRTSDAQEVETTFPRGELAEAKRGRTIGSHSFSELRTIMWPFVSTRVTSLTALGVAEFDESPEALTFDFDGSFSTFRERFELSLAATDWLGFELAFEGGVLGGIDRVGALVVGANYGTTGAAGFVLRLFENDRFYVSARGGGSITRVEGISPTRVIDAVQIIRRDESLTVNSVSLTNVSINQDGEIYNLAGGLAAAAGLSRRWGLLASAQIGWQNIDIADAMDENEGNLQGGLGVSFNLASSGVPIQFLAGGRLSWDFSDDRSDLVLSAIQPADDFRVEPEVGIFYSGNAELELGFSVTSVLSSDDRRIGGNLRLGYFW